MQSEAKHQQHSEAPPTSLDPNSSEMDWCTVEKCAVVWQVHISTVIVFGKTWTMCKEEKHHPDCYQHKVQNPASVMVWGCVSAHGIMGNMHICEGTINAERHIHVYIHNILSLLMQEIVSCIKSSVSLFVYRPVEVKVAQCTFK